MKALRNKIHRVRGLIQKTNFSSAEREERDGLTTAISRRHPTHAPFPEDMVYETAHYVDTGHLYKMLFLNKSIHKLVLPLLYADIDTRLDVAPDRRQINGLNKTLKQNPNRALLIHRWVIGVDVVVQKEQTKTKILPPTTMALVIWLAEGRHLINLRRFWWLWQKGPSEELWAALQKRCPLLKDVGVRLGAGDMVIDPDSSLLKFRNLVGFHLMTHGIYRHVEGQVEPARLPAELYEMLLRHCPRLRKLTIDGSSPQQCLWDISFIFRGNWPELRSLSLGMIKGGRYPVGDDLVRAFISKHPELRELHFLGAAHWTNQEVYPIPSHQRLTTFRGRFAQLKRAEDLPSLGHIYLTDLFMDSANYQAILRRFSAITSLGLLVDVQRGMLKSMCLNIFIACPLLEHFELRLRQSLSDYMTIIETTRIARRLRSVVLAGVSNFVDTVSMPARGQMIIQENPRLDYFALYFGGQFTNIHISGAQVDNYIIGEYTVLRDQPYGRAKKLMMRIVKKSPAGYFAHNHIKDITQDLREPGDLTHTTPFGYGDWSPSGSLEAL